MNSVLCHKLSGILGTEQLNIFLLKLKMVRNFVSVTLKHVQIGKSEDKQTFQQFKKLLKCILLVSDNFHKLFKWLWKNIRTVHRMFTAQFRNFEKQGNDNLYLQLSNKLKIVFESMDLINKLYQDTKKHKNGNDTVKCSTTWLSKFQFQHNFSTTFW